MKITDMEYIKKHARIDGDYEDDILEMYAESAEETLLQLLNRDIESIYNEFGKIPVPLKHAVCMLTAHGYTHREPTSTQNLYNVPYTLDLLIKPYMIL